MTDNYLILAVEDDKALRSLYVEYLQNKGYRVDSAANGVEALERLTSHAYDLVLIDLKLPDMNGIDILKQIKDRSPDTVPIILSGHATLELTIEAISLGAFDFLIKPVQLAKLLLTVENGLEKRKISLHNQKLISELKISKKNLEATIRERTDQMKKSERKFRHLYDNAPDVYYTVDTRGRIIDCNKMASEFFGASKKELKAKHLLDLYTSDNFEKVASMVPTPDGKGGRIRHKEVKVKKADGTIAWVEINSNLLYDSDGKVAGALTIQRDITGRKNAEDQLRESEERYRTIFQTAEVALLELDFHDLTAVFEKLKKEGVKNWEKYLEKNPDFIQVTSKMVRVVDVNQAAIKIFEAGEKQELRRPALDFYPESEVKNYLKFITALAVGESNFQAETTLTTLKGNQIHALLNLTVPPREAKFKNLLVGIVDITYRIRLDEEKDQLLSKLHQLNKQLETLAVTDGLTKLYNHRFFMETLNREFARARRMEIPLALMIADIDDFKNFNDNYGHQLGDEVLVRVSDVLRSSRRGSDIVARYGGEEFVLLLPDTSLDQAMNVAERTRKGVEKIEIKSRNKTLKVTISLGVYTLTKDNVLKPKELLIRADKALYLAKRGGKNTVCTIKENAAV
ncbi:MAG: diguanylate cyclase [Candidatus Glassbacteria bacterium]